MTTYNEQVLNVAKLVIESMAGIDPDDIKEFTNTRVALWVLYEISNDVDIFHLHNQARILELEALLRIA